MKTINKIRFELVCVEWIPEVRHMEYGKLYYSEKYSVTNHLCPCGCGTQTPLPIKTGEWGIAINDDKFTITPSVLHRTGCQTHYVINDNIVSILGPSVDENVMYRILK